MTEPPSKVSILIRTYNHERFIAQAIESVLMQEREFGIEIVIGEDCSTDRTREIVRAYSAKYPGVIKPLLHERNIGRRQNFLETLQRCSGEYVAQLDGDDYWTHPGKITRQVALLESQPHFSQCFHPVLRITEEGTPPLPPAPIYPPGRRAVYSLEDFRLSNFVSSCSCLTRNTLLKKGIPDILRAAPYTDWVWRALDAVHGDVAYIDEVMAVYRIHEGGVMAEARHSEALKIRRVHEVCSLLADYLGPAYDEIFKPVIFNQHFRLAEAALRMGETEQALRHAQACLEMRPFNRHYAEYQLRKLYLRARYPWLNQPIRSVEKLVDSLAHRKKAGADK